MHVYAHHYIGGTWVTPSSTEAIDVIDPATEEVMGRVPAGTPADVRAAVAAARTALEGWSTTPGDERGKALLRVRDTLEARRDELATLITREVGAPIEFSNRVQLGMPIASFATAAHLAATYEWDSQDAGAMITREPIGVVGAITPWNYPLNQASAKVAYAIGAGCTVVLKPSEVTPISALVLAEIFDEVGVPDGVFNVVSGTGPSVGEALAIHPDVDMISF